MRKIHRTQKKRRLRKKSKKSKKQKGGNLKESSSKSIIITVQSGFGNQLCIYSVGLLLQKKLNMPLLIAAFDHPEYKKYFTKGTPIEEKDIEQYKSEGYESLSQEHCYAKFDFSTVSFDKSKHVVLERNYYQHYNGLKDGIPLVVENILPQLEKSYKTDVDTKYTNLSKNSENSMFVHIRRGDYLQHTDLYNIGDMEYYNKGVSIVLEKRPNIQSIYIVSDDISWCKEQKWQHSNDKEFIFVEESDELKTIYIMSVCKGGAVLSSSTFGLWGALFGVDRVGGVIVYPSKWHSSGDMNLPESDKWIKV